MQSHTDGDNTSQRWGSPGKPRTHVTGSSVMREERTGMEFINTWDIKDRGHELETNMGSHLGTDRFNVSSNHPEVIKHYREVQRQAARAAYAGRPAAAVPKPGGQGKTKGTKTCPECEGSGMVWFGDEEEQCRRCGGTGRV